jgi:hypothetical protein
MIGFAILATQIAVTPTPSPRPAFTPTTLGQSVPPAPNSLGGFARTRQINKAALDGPVAQASPEPTSAASAEVKKKLAINLEEEAIKEEMYWKDRAARLRAEIAATIRERDEIAAKIPTYVWTNRNGSQVSMTAERDAAIAPYQVKIDRLQREMDGLPEECRKASCQPGWIR